MTTLEKLANGFFYKRALLILHYKTHWLVCGLFGFGKSIITLRIGVVKH